MDSLNSILTLSVYPHRASLKNMPAHGGNEPTTFGILAQCWLPTELSRGQVGSCMWYFGTESSSFDIMCNHYFFCVGVMSHTRTDLHDLVAQLAEHWASIPKVVGSFPTVARHIFQACPVWIHTQSNITSFIYSPIHRKIILTLLYKNHYAVCKRSYCVIYTSCFSSHHLSFMHVIILCHMDYSNILKDFQAIRN